MSGRRNALAWGLVCALLCVSAALAAFSVAEFHVQYNQVDSKYSNSYPAGFEYDNYVDNVTTDEFSGYVTPAISTDKADAGCSATDGCKVVSTTIENDLLVAWCQSPTSTSEGNLEFTSSVSEGTWTYQEQSTSYVSAYLFPSSSKTGWDFDCRYTTSNISMTGSVVETTVTEIDTSTPVDASFPVLYTGTGAAPSEAGPTPKNSVLMAFDTVFCDGTSTSGAVGSGWTEVEYEDSETGSAILTESQEVTYTHGITFAESTICSSGIAYTELLQAFDVPWEVGGQCPTGDTGSSSYASPVSLPSADTDTYPVYCLNTKASGYASTDDVYVNQFIFGSAVSTTDVYTLMMQEGVNAGGDQVAVQIYFEIPTAPSSTTELVVLFDGTSAGQASDYGQAWTLFACTSSSSCP